MARTLCLTVKPTPFLTTLLCTLALLCTTHTVRAGESEKKSAKKSCCEATADSGGKKRPHDCCKKAAEAGKACEKCQPKKG